MTPHPTDVRRAGSGGVTFAGMAPERHAVLDEASLPAELRPDRNLLKYYLLSALVFGPGFLIAIFPMYFRFHTLRYDVDAEGITMRWGILFRREISLTYARIQDIQLSSNVVERWLGLARIQLQTASGSAAAEMTIEGLRDVEAMRDFLYARMRGAGGRAGGGAITAGRGSAAASAASLASATAAAGTTAAAAVPGATPDGSTDAAALEELTATLHAVADEVGALRALIENRTGRGGDA